MIALNLRAKKNALMILGEQRQDVAQGTTDIGGHSAQCLPERGFAVTALDQHDPIDLNCEQLLGVRCEIGHTLLNGLLHQRIRILPMENCRLICFEQRLINPDAWIESAQSLPPAVSRHGRG